MNVLPKKKMEPAHINHLIKEYKDKQNNSLPSQAAFLTVSRSKINKK